MNPMEASATIQRIADSGLEISNADYRALVEVAQWLATLPTPQPEDWAERAEYEQRQRDDAESAAQQSKEQQA